VLLGDATVPANAPMADMTARVAQAFMRPA
jgi:hypothetical protein